MKFLVIFFCLFCSFQLSAKEKRCGWLENPSPSNLWLIDKHGTWLIALQGVPNDLDDKSLDLAYSAIENEKKFVRTNFNYGFSCACLTVDLVKEDKFVTKVYESEQLDLKKCLEDTSITEYIPLHSE